MVGRLGQVDKAIAAYKRYVTRFKDKKDVPDIAFNIGLIQEKDKKWAEAIKVYDGFLTTYAKDTRVNDVKRIDAKYRQFLAYKLLKDASAMDKTAKEIAAMYPKLNDADKEERPREWLRTPTCASTSWSRCGTAYLAVKFNNVKTFKTDLQTKPEEA